MISKIKAANGLLIDSIRKNNRNSEKLLNKLASGSRINSASDDPAGLAVAKSLSSEASVLAVGNRNIGYGNSAAAIAEGATQQISSSLIRMQELATQAANGTLSDEQRASIATEFEALKEEVNRVTNTTEFNGKSLLSGDGFSVQVGNNGDANSQIHVSNIDVKGTLEQQGFNSLTLANAGAAQTSIDQLSNLIGKVSETQGRLGALTSRLEVAENNNSSRIVALKDSQSRIEDADVAETTANLLASKIRQKSGVAMLAQAGKLEKESVLRLLS